MGYPAFQRSRAFKFARKTNANPSINSTSYMDVDTALDLTLEAQVGDVIEVGASWLWYNEAFVGSADVFTIVSSAPVNGFGGTNGITAFYGVSGTLTAVGGSCMKTLVAGDIAAGLVTLRLRAKINSAGAKQIISDSSSPLDFWAKNLGPADPH